VKDVYLKKTLLDLVADRHYRIKLRLGRSVWHVGA